MLVLGFALAALIGLSLGLLGAGGSMITVPILVYVLGFEAKQAIAMSLAVVATTALAGAVGHRRLGHVRLRLALGFGVVAMIGAYAGARLAVFLSGAAQLALLGTAMLGAAVSMYRQTWREGTASPARVRRLGLVWGGVVGLGVGMLTGLAGVGGGFLIVPTLVLFAALPMKEAVGTSLVVIAMNAGAGFAGYVGRVEIPWGFLVLFTAAAVAGIGGGTYLVRFVSPRGLTRAFSVFLVLMGALILYANRGAFRL